MIRLQGQDGFEGVVIGPEAFLFRIFGAAGDERLVLVNLGVDLDLPSLPEPLLAPLDGHSWALLWSSEHPDYGGEGTPPVETGGRWFLPGRATVVMASRVESGP
ncbi:DUF3459 domain-containing protein [Rubellimicrobium mesophilum]|uniref:DUF3459 domain-containing protein n=1 Tax=Rubellimicrobium mesophilum TaxID=1123067 RepID=UPI001B7FF772